MERADEKNFVHRSLVGRAADAVYSGSDFADDTLVEFDEQEQKINVYCTKTGYLLSSEPFNEL